MFSLVLTTLRHLQVIFPAMPAPFAQIVEQTVAAADRIRPLVGLDYAGYFMLGHYIHTRNFERKHGVWFAVIGVLSIVYTTVMTGVISMRDGYLTEVFVGNVTTNVCLSAISVMICVKVFTEKMWYKDNVYKTILYLSQTSFGIFLVHAFLLRVLDQWGINALSFAPILATPLISIGVALVSTGVAYLLKKIPKAGEYLV